MSRLMQLTDFDALSFDCYGTLIDWEAGISAVLGPWASAHGVAASSEELLERYAQIEAREEAEHPTTLYPDVLDAAMRSLASSFGVHVSSADAKRLATSVGEWPAFPDSPAALRALSQQYKLVILSNVDRASFAMSNARLGVEFDAIITAQDVGSYKPALHNFEVLVQRVRAMGVADGRLLHVAQSLFHDHVPAQRLGLRTVWIDRRGARHGWGATPPPPAAPTPDWTFPSMAAFAAACHVEQND
jgi:2-haloacid dehalogenase